MSKAIFIAATGQNVGKTTLCLGMMAALRKRFGKVGFIKPVGQQHIKVDSQLNVDKDVVLFKEHFGLKTHYADMSPVILPAGFTRDFLDGQVQETELCTQITRSYHKIASENEFTLVEGTGHIGVGSIVHLNNAKVASLLNLEVVIIASGGLGSAYDELALNIGMCRHYGVKVKGVILNRVLEDKRSMIETYFPKALKDWNIPLFGCVPFNPFLSSPTLKDFEVLFKTSLITGENHYFQHFSDSRLVAGSLAAFYEEDKPSNELIITPASREDIIEAALKRYQQARQENRQWIKALILTGRQMPSQVILGKIKQTDMPALYAPLCSYDAMKMITSFTAKIRVEDLPKIEQAIELVEKHLDFDQLLSLRNRACC